jgi:antitoxin component YwqK of YwqJK toxin-antitoxin module
LSEYRSSIPAAATEQVIETYDDGRPKRCEYLIDGAAVGVRFFHEGGQPMFEYGLKDGLPHGMQYRWDIPGVLLSAEPYVDGLPHGTAMQWSDDGQLVGSYTMVRGTGIDLWWGGCDERALSEARYIESGQRHGFEWWIHPNQRQVTEELHCWHGQPHGIERQWNEQGRLRRGYPRYYVDGERVSKRRYLRACAARPELPPFREQDQRPERDFPPQVARHLRREP